MQVTIVSLSTGLRLQRDDSGLNPPSNNGQHPDASRQGEPLRSGRPWIEQQRWPILLNGRTMTVAKYTAIGLFLVQPRSCFRCQLPALEQDVADSNRHPGATDHARPGEPAFFESIDVARHGDDRGNSFELPNDFRIADITGMKNYCDTREVLNDRLIKQAMSIGDDADVRLALGDHGAATG